jgi:hypothetical protein
VVRRLSVSPTVILAVSDDDTSRAGNRQVEVEQVVHLNTTRLTTGVGSTHWRAMASLEVRIAAIDVLFSETYDAAPPLPRPLRSQHELKYITGKGLLAESLSVAPLTTAEEGKVVSMGLGDVRSQDDDPKVVKYTKRLMIYYRKAGEFALVHAELGAWYERQSETVSTINTATSFFVSGVVLMGIAVPSIALAIIVVIVGMMKSWIMYVKYDTLEAGHSNAARAFSYIAETIKDLLAVMADLEPQEVAEEFGGGDKADMAETHDCVRGALNKYKEVRARAKAIREAAANATKGESKVRPVGNSGDESVETGPVGEATATQVVLRLRTLYRRAVQYRLAHSLFETKFRRLRIGLAFAHLTLTTVTSACMFLNVEGGVIDVLSVLLTGLNTVIQSTGFAQKESDHTAGRISWASVQRSFATVLMLYDSKEIRNRFSEYSTKYVTTLESSVPLKGLQFFRSPADKNKPMFDLISPDMSSEMMKKHGGWVGQVMKRFEKKTRTVQALKDEKVAEAKNLLEGAKEGAEELAAEGQGAALDASQRTEARQKGMLERARGEVNEQGGQVFGAGGATFMSSVAAVAPEQQARRRQQHGGEDDPRAAPFLTPAAAAAAAAVLAADEQAHQRAGEEAGVALMSAAAVAAEQQAQRQLSAATEGSTPLQMNGTPGGRVITLAPT